jgi:hypothetical protein
VAWRRRGLAGACWLALACAGGAAREADRPFSVELAAVDALAVLVYEGSTPAAVAVARGHHPDACTRIHEVELRRLGNTFDVTLTTRRDSRETCAPGRVPFEREVTLPLDPAAAGAYLVTVNGVTQAFHVLARPDAGDRFELRRFGAPE